METYAICYVSTATKGIDRDKIHDLFNNSCQKNIAQSISGILLYNEGNFMQILEGTKSHLMTLFQSIKKDSRHNDIITLLDKPIPYSLFKGYNSGFSTIENNEHIESLKDYLNLLEFVEDTNTSFVVSVLHRFLNTISPRHFVF